MTIISRRAALMGLAGLSVPAGAAVASVAPAPLTQREIAERVHDLAAEMSQLLSDLDGGNWDCLVKPAFHGEPMYDVMPTHLPPRIRLEQGLAKARRALNDLNPGDYHTFYDLDLALPFAAIAKRGVA